jgi:KDO2-lipid IV(A) lauroyltransferase
MTGSPIGDAGRWLRYAAGRSAVGLLSGLPRPAGLGLGRFLGRIGHALVRRDRDILRHNLELVHPGWSDADRSDFGRRVFERLGENIFDVASLPRWTPDERRARIAVAGFEHLQAAIAAGRGVLLVGGHQGAWELVAPALVDRGVTVQGLSRPVREARLDAWLDDHRAAMGSRTIKVGTLAGARRAHRLLTGGGVLGLLIDHRVRRGGRWVEFFGRPSRFATGPARLAVATGAAMVPVAITRRDDGGHRVTIAPALAAPAAGSTSARVGVLLDAAVRALEAMIAPDPASWAWMHPRWGRANPSMSERLSATPRTAMCLLFAALLLGGTSCGHRPTGDAPPPAPNAPSTILTGITLRETDQGKLRWILKADSSETFTQPNQTIARNIHVDFFDALGQPTSTLTADEGVVQRSNNDMTARGHVVVITTKGDTLTTERLDWSSVQNRVKTDLPFRLGRPDVVMTGVGFESDPDLTKYNTREVRIDARDAVHDGSR